MRALAGGGSFGALTPLLAPRSVAVIGASDRDGNLGGLAVKSLQKFGFQGPVWPVNAGRASVAGLPCYSRLTDLPGTPDLAVIAVAADSVTDVVRDCGGAGVPAAVVWAGGFAEVGKEGVARQRTLEAACRETRIKLCGPNCLGIINTSVGLTASFSSLMTELTHFNAGHVSIISQSGGIAITTHARAQAMGHGFRVTISCGNEVGLGIPDFIHALVEDDGTRAIAIYTEGIVNPDGFVAALTAAKARRKPVILLKGGATEASSKAVLAHTGKLAGSDRTYDAIFREFAVIRVHSPEDLLDVSLQMASKPAGRVAAGNRVLISTFGGGSGVIATDQCAREGMTVPPLSRETRAKLEPLMSSLASSANPVDMTPGAITNPKLRPNMPAVLHTLSHSTETDLMVVFGAGFSHLAPEVATFYRRMFEAADRPILLSWTSPPEGIIESLSEAGIMVFSEHSRTIKTAGHLVRYAADLRHRISRDEAPVAAFPWEMFTTGQGRVVSEHIAAAVLEAAGLNVARGRMATSLQEALAHAAEIGFPVVMKGISSQITHRAAAGLLALDLGTPDAVSTAYTKLTARAAEIGVKLDGIWVQHMFAGKTELLVTAFRDPDFGVIVGCGMGGGMTEVIDDVVFSRAPIGRDGAEDLLRRLRTLTRLPAMLSSRQLALAAEFVARFSRLAASAPWKEFTFEVNPLKLAEDDAAAVDGLLIVG